MPIDFDGNWLEMNVRPTAAFLYGISVAPRSSGLGLPRVVAFPLLLFDRPDSNSKATRFFFRTAETPPATIGHRSSEIQRAGGLLDAVDSPVTHHQIPRADFVCPSGSSRLGSRLTDKPADAHIRIRISRMEP